MLHEAGSFTTITYKCRQSSDPELPQGKEKKTTTKSREAEERKEGSNRQTTG